MFNWRELPFVRLLVPLIAGILLGCFFHYFHGFLIGIWLGCFGLLWAASKFRGMYRFRWLFGALMYLLVFQLGYLSVQVHDEKIRGDYFGENISPEETMLLATVKDAPTLREKWVRLEARIDRLGLPADGLTEGSGNLLLYVERDGEAEAIRYGDQLFFSGRISEVGPPTNPHAFDYQKYLHFQNIHHQAFVRNGAWEVVVSGRGNPFFAKAIVLQKHFLATLRKHLPTENEYAVGSALILGYRDEIPEEVQTAYSQTGAMHVLAVSGLHVGIVFLLLNFFLKKIKLNLLWWRFAKAAIVLMGIWGFALVTGASPSVTRAAVMFTCVQVGLVVQRDPNIYNTLSASAFIMLLWNPYLLASVSFQLSYLAVFGIVFFQPRFAKLIYVRQPFLRKMWQLVCVSLAAQLMLVPLTFFYFHQFPTYFWLTSLLLVPLAGFELGAGLVLLLMENIWPLAAAVFGKILWLMLKVGNGFVLFVQGLPAAVFDGIWIGGFLAALLYLVLTISMLAVASRKFRWALFGLGFLVVCSINLAFTSWERTASHQVVVYDVYKHTVVDVFDGKNVLSILSGNADAKAVGFATEGHRFAMGMKNLETIPLDKMGKEAAGDIFYEDGFLQFHGLEMAIVDRPLSMDVGEKIELDYVLVSGSPKIFIEEIQSVFACGKIIFDHSNKKWQVGKWKTKCRELGVEYYDVAEEGALVLDL